MTDYYFDGETFSKIDYSLNNINKGEYDNCIFENCNFEGVHASNIQFLECQFINCNFSNTIVKTMSFKEVLFDNCKMIGVKFTECDPFLLQLKFNSCQLDYSSFYQLNIPTTNFINCSLKEVDFTEANMQQVIFESCNLQGAIFSETNIEQADFTTASQFTIDLENNKIKKAKFSKNNIIGLLQKYQIQIH